MPSALHCATLDNGLRVIIKPAFKAPVISTWIWYRVGSRDEVEGSTGLSHWVEHMMFKGSTRFGKGQIMRSIDRCGGYCNAMTSHDFTAYYATLPSDKAELALDIEADRMRGALFDPDETEAERTVILSEREGNENEPRFLLSETMAATAFMVHPYHHQTIGWEQDLRRATRDQLYAHYGAHYTPENAVLVVVGALDPNEYFGRIASRFESIPAAPPPPDLARPEPPQLGERRVTVRMPTIGAEEAAPRIIRIAHRAPSVADADFVPLVVLDAVLSGGKAIYSFDSNQTRSARLYRALVETDLASGVGSNYHPSRDPYLHTTTAIVRQGRTPREVEEALTEALSRLAREAVTQAEMGVAIRQTQAQLAYSSESVTNQALALGLLEMVDTYEREQRLLDEIALVTPDDVQRVAATYLVADNRTVGWVVPGDAAQGASDSCVHRTHSALGATAAGLAPTVCFYRPPAVLGPDTIRREELDNGVTVLATECPSSASVTVAANIDAGGVHEGDPQAGLATLTAQMARRGTRTRTFVELNSELDALGASIELAASSEGASVYARSLAEDMDVLLGLLGEILRAATIPADEWERIRGQILTHLAVLDEDTGYRSGEACMALLYPPGHPYARPTLGTPETVSALTRDDVLSFYRRCYVPQRVAIAVVGAVDPERAVDRVSGALGSWRATEIGPTRDIPAARTPSEPLVARVALPSKSQVDMDLATVGMPRRSPDYYPGMMANMVLGRQGMMGRLGSRVRDEQGLAYYVSSHLPSGIGPQPWTVSAGVHPDNVERALSAILQEIDRLRDDGITDEEMDDCRSYLTGVLPLALETNQGIANYLLGLEEHGLGLDFITRYPDILASVSRDDVRRVAREYLSTEGYALAMAGTFGD